MDMTHKYVRWITALRESTHPQAQGVMYDGEGYCVYGVLEREVYGEVFTLQETTQPHQVEFTWCDSLGMNLEPHQSRIEDMQLDTEVTEEELWKACGYFTPRVMDTTRLDLLGQMNDARVPFEQIAEFMEAAGWAESPASSASYPSALSRLLYRRAIESWT